MWKDFRIAHTRAGLLPDPVDADLVPMMLGGTDTFSFNYSHSYGTSTRKALPYALALKVLPRAAEAKRLAIRGERMQQFTPLAWDEGDPWRLLLEIRQDDRDQWAITGALARGEERMQLTEPSLVLRGGFVIARGAIARLEDDGAYAWIEQLLAIRQIPFPDRERDAVIASLLNTPFLPKLELDEPLRFEERVVRAKARAAHFAGAERLGRGAVHRRRCCSITAPAGWRSRFPAAVSGCRANASFCCATRRPKRPRTNSCAPPGCDPRRPIG